jgi:hypothetical protein
MHTGPRRRLRRATFGRMRPRKSARPGSVPVLAVLGTLLAAVALPIKAAGVYHISQVLERMKLEAPEDRSEPLVFAAVGHPLAVANGMLFAGGAMIIYAFRWGGFQERWFLWASLILSLFYLWQPVWGTVFALVWLNRVALAWKQMKPPAVREVTLIPE